MGNQLIKGYSIEGQPQTLIGNYKSWKLYKGKKQGSNLPVSIFLIEKKQLKTNKEQVLKTAKKQAINLAKIRHPGVLALVEPLIQDQNIVAFVAQRIQGNITSLVRTNKLQEFLNSELQIKMNLLSFLQTVYFLHQNVRLCHLGINFDNIFVTSQGKWKLSGMSYSQSLSDQQFMVNQVQFMDYMHCSPQLVNEAKFNDKSDSFSIGILIINLLKALKKQYKSQITAKDRGQYERNMANLKNLAQTQILTKSQKPEQLFKVLAQLLNPNSENRLKISQIGLSQWINDKTVLTVKYLQKICNYEVKQQLQFLKGFAGVIEDFDNRILVKRILPILMDLLKFNQLIASIIFITIDIIKKNLISVQNFKIIVWPSIKSVTQGKEMTAQSLFLLVSNMNILQTYVGQTQFFNCIVPLYLKCFDCPPKLKVLALRGVQKMSKKYDYQFTKSKIIPKLVNIMKDQSLDIRKDALKALYTIIGSVDAQTISTVILAGLQSSRKAGADNFINSITVQIYNKMIKNLSSQVLGSKIIPALLPYLTDPAIKKSQFLMYKTTLFRMIQKIQMQRKKTWTDENNETSQKFTQKDFLFSKQQEIKKQGNQKSNYSFLNQYAQDKKPEALKIENKKTQEISNDICENVQQQVRAPTIVTKNQFKISQQRPAVRKQIKTTPSVNQYKKPASNNISSFKFQQPKNKIDFEFSQSFKPINPPKVELQQNFPSQMKPTLYTATVNSQSDYKPPFDEFDFEQRQVKYQPIDQSTLSKPLQNKQLPFSPQTSTLKIKETAKPVQKKIQKPLDYQKPKIQQKRQEKEQIKPLIKNQRVQNQFTFNEQLPMNTLGQKKVSQTKLQSPKKLVGPKIKKPNNVNPYSLQYQNQKKDDPFQSINSKTEVKTAQLNTNQFNGSKLNIKEQSKTSFTTNIHESDFNWLGNASQKSVQSSPWQVPKINNQQSAKIESTTEMSFDFQSKLQDDDPFAQVDKEYGMTTNSNNLNIKIPVSNIGQMNLNTPFSTDVNKQQQNNSDDFGDLI